MDPRRTCPRSLVLAALLLGGLGASAQAAPAGTVAAWGFEEGSGAVAADASGHGHAGQIVGATWTEAGKIGRALCFDGDGDRVLVPDAADLDLFDGMTLEAWVKPRSLRGWTTVVMKERPGGLLYALYGSDGAARPPAGYVHNGADQLALGQRALPLGVWTHLAATFSGGRLKLYVDGVLVRTRSVAGALHDSTAPLSIGGNGVWGEWFDGCIDEVRIYSVAATAAQVVADASTAVTPRCGNGLLEAGERCDDGNELPGDGCRADCFGVEACGDGLLDLVVGEVCDDGNTASGDTCRPDCLRVCDGSFDAAACAGLECGEVEDACGVTAPCGACAAPDTCGGGGAPGQCGCTADDAAACAGRACGDVVNACGATVTCGACAAPASCEDGVCVAPPSGPILWVADRAANVVRAVETTAGGGVVATIAVGTAPQWLALTPDRTKVYVANSGSASVSVIDTGLRAVIATIAVGANPEVLDITPDGTRVYVADSAGSVVSTATDTVTTTLIGATTLAVRADGAELWVLSGWCPWCPPKPGSFSGDTFRVYSLPAHTQLYGSGFADGITGPWLEFLPDGSALYANNGCGQCGNLQRWSGTSYGKLSDRRWGTAGSTGLALSPDGATVYSGFGGGSVARLRASDGALLSTAAVAGLGLGLAVSPDGAEVFAGTSSGRVLVLDATTLAVARELAVDGAAQHLVVQAVGCGICTPPATCGGGGVPDLCGCTADDAAACAGRLCGDVVNACGRTVSCGACVGFDTCGGGGVEGACGCTPDDAAACAGRGCGEVVNRCGETVTCGTCEDPAVCESGACRVPGSGPLVWIVERAANAVEAVDPSPGGGVVATIPVGTAPQWLALTPDGGKAYVANYGSGTVSVIDTAARAVVATVAVGAQPEVLDITPDGTRVYVADSMGTVLSTATDTVTTTLIGATTLAIRADGAELWVLSGWCPWCPPKPGSFSGDTFRVYSLPGHTQLHGSGFADGITGPWLEFLPDGSALYANNGCGQCGNLQRWSGTSYGKLSDRRWGTAGSTGLALSPDGATVYSGFGGGSVARLRASDGALLSTAAVAGLGLGLAVSDDGAEVFAGASNGRLLVLDATSLAILRELPLAGVPALVTAR